MWRINEMRTYGNKWWLYEYNRYKSMFYEGYRHKNFQKFYSDTSILIIPSSILCSNLTNYLGT